MIPCELAHFQDDIISKGEYLEITIIKIETIGCIISILKLNCFLFCH